jgi:hypothetical protein
MTAELALLLQFHTAGAQALYVVAQLALAWSSLTPDEEVTSHDEHQADWSQYKASTVAVVLVTHKTDATHRVPIHLWQEGMAGTVSH